MKSPNAQNYLRWILFILFINIAFAGVKDDIENEYLDCVMMSILVDGEYDNKLILAKKKDAFIFS